MDYDSIRFQIGTIVRNKLTNQTYIVTDNGDVCIVTRTISICNPDEWEVIPKPEKEE